MVIIGNFQSIDGISRTRLALIELEGQATVSNWNTDVYDVQCPVLRLPQYIRGIDISPDNSYVVVGSQGWRRVAEPACDTTVRFELSDLSGVQNQRQLQGVCRLHRQDRRACGPGQKNHPLHVGICPPYGAAPGRCGDQLTPRNHQLSTEAGQLQIAEFVPPSRTPTSARSRTVRHRVLA